MRNNKIIKSGLETEVSILSDKKYNEVFNNVELNDFLVCSKVNFNNKLSSNGMESLKTVNGIKVSVKKALGKKCQHCWRISEDFCGRKYCQIK